MIISKNMKAVSVCVEEEAFPGVKRIAAKVATDLKEVTGKEIEVTTPDKAKECRIIAATVGKSAILDSLKAKGCEKISAIEGKWEVYSYILLDATDEEPETLVVAGSDKRGTIYGLFHLSEIAGVSPWVWFADVKPAHRDFIEITEKDCITSKEPSVKYRGFFINDEWPAFGNWTFRHFGGFTTEMYEHVFELLLRLKGNYLWPAMWTSNFSLDGPGLTNAELADEMGIVMSNSHHEPCLRHSEEWDIIKGEDTPYGTAWNFDKNKEGLTNYWRGGLQRNGKFENIITMGMRGERDSEVLGTTATLKDNIDYLKEVIVTQNRLIKETISDDLSKTRRMLAIYKEVEKYFHGDETTEGLKTWDGLDGITCMLCEDNFGNLRTLPEKEQRDRDGGWGMYYHFDYHGDPISYEWVCSTHISRTCDQMSQAYEYGIKEIWIVNVGDLKPQELPLSYFLDMAYDIDKWGHNNPNAVSEYLDLWVAKQFPALSADADVIKQLLDGYTKLNSVRKPEALGTDTYHPTNYGESDAVLAMAKELEEKAEGMLAKVKGTADYDAFYQLVYFPVVASMTVIRLQLLGGKNELLAKQGAVSANAIADEMKLLIEKDRTLEDEYHAINGGKWDGLMLSEHIGFRNWNDEECCYPVRMYVEPANKPRMIVSAGNSSRATMGGDWTGKKQMLTAFLDPKVKESFITVRNGANDAFDAEIICEAKWIKVESEKFKVKTDKVIKLTVDRAEVAKAAANGYASAVITVKTSFAHADIEVLATVSTDETLLPVLPEEVIKAANNPYAKAILKNELGIAFDMTDAKNITKGSAGEYRLLPGFGKYGSAVKAFPVDITFKPGVDAPSAEFEFTMENAGDVEITFITAPDNPPVKGNPMNIGYSLNGGDILLQANVLPGYEGGERVCSQWFFGALDQQHTATVIMQAKQGKNVLKIYAADADVVLERILVRQAGTQWADGYIGFNPLWNKR